jgi:hypothetical protein
LKGGKQDRTVQYDIILYPKSAEVPVPAYCVEQARWSRRGGEDVTKFSGSSNYLSSKSLKMAAKYYKSQTGVWDEVASVQRKSALNAHVPLSAVQGESSYSSLDLTMENQTIKERTQKYIDDLQNIDSEKNDIVGYAFAINGKINNIDVYSSNSLFKKMWPKLLSAAALEAFTELAGSNEFSPPTCQQVHDCMLDVEKEKGKSTAVNGAGKTILRESKLNVLFETLDTKSGGAWVHRNYVVK